MQGRISVLILPPYLPFLIPTEQAHSCVKADSKRQLTSQQVSQELQNDVGRLDAGMTELEWRLQIMLRAGLTTLNSITVQKCLNLCGRVNRYMPASFNGQVILE